MAIFQDFKFALRSLARARGLSATVILTLALGIGANASIFSVVRGVLLRPLVNRDEGRLVYIRQSAPGNRIENSPSAVSVFVRSRRSRISGTENVVFSAPMPGALCLM